MPAPEHLSSQVLAQLVTTSDRFVAYDEMGRGASGVVFDVLDRECGERMALKVCSRPDAVRMRHARELLKLSQEHPHPNLIPIVDVGDLSGHPFYVMPKLQGEPWSTRGGHNLRALVIQLLQGLGCLHAAGWLHRDVKPANTWVCDDGRVVLLDLDMAVRFGPDTVSATPVGTPGYMSPEQLSGGLLFPASDLYAVGVLLHEALTGRRPQSGSTSRATIPDLTDVDERADADLVALCEGLLGDDPKHRPGAYHALRRLAVPGADIAAQADFAAQPAFVGRRGPLQKLVDAQTHSLERSGWVHVQGPSGRGKTRLVREACGAFNGDVRVLCVGFERRSHTPYGALDDLAQQIAREFGSQPVQVDHPACLLEVFPSLSQCLGPAATQDDRPPDPHERRFRAQRSLRQLLAQLCQSRPTVLVLDDVQWAAADAAWLVAHCQPPVERGWLLITVSSRSASTVRSGAGPVSLELEPLSAAEATELRRKALQSWDTHDAAGTESTAGDPWDVLQAVAGSLSPDGDRVWAELQDASCRSPLRRCLALLAVAARPVRLDELLQASEEDELELSWAVHELFRLGWLASQGDGSELSVATRVAERALAELDDAEREQCTTAWARVWRSQGALLDEAGTYGDTDGEVAASCCMLAANQAGKALAFSRAADLADRALSNWQESEETRWHEAAQWLALAGRNRQAARAYARAAASANAADKFRWSERAAALSMRSGDIELALTAARGVLENVGLTLPDSTGEAVASLLYNKAALALGRRRVVTSEPSKIPRSELARVDALWSMGTFIATTDAMRGLALTTRCTRLSLRCGERNRMARALLYEALHDVVVEPPPMPRAARRVADAQQMLGDDPEPLAKAQLRLVQGVGYFFKGETRLAVDTLREADALYCNHENEYLLNHLTTRQFLIQSLLTLTRVGDVDRLADDFLQQAHARGDLHAVAQLTAVGGVPAHLLARDDPEGARQMLARSMEPWPRDEIYMQHFNELLAHLMILEYERQPGIYDAVEGLIAPLAKTPIMRAPPIRAAIEGFRAHACIVEAEHALQKDRAMWVKRSRRSVRQMQGMRVAFAYRRALMLWPSVHLLEGDRDAALAATVAARKEFVDGGQDATWCDLVEGGLRGGQAGRDQVLAARLRLSDAGYASVERAMGPCGVTLV